MGSGTVQLKLEGGVVYVAFDRFVCSFVACAGNTALATGYSIDGHKLRKVDAQDLAEWATYDLGALKCECGRVTAGGA
jgi:hypothetical protein